MNAAITISYLNQVRMQAHAAAQSRSAARVGIVSSYDPNTYSVKVRLQPEDVETGWIPLKSAWVGNGWGLFAPPSIGDAIEVLPIESDFESAAAGERFYSDADRPLPCPSGEFWLVHESGSLLKFKNGGDVEVHVAGALAATVAGSATVSVGGDASLSVGGSITSSAASWSHTGNFTVTGDVTATGDVKDHSTHSMASIRSIYNSHVHGGSPTPTPTM